MILSLLARDGEKILLLLIKRIVGDVSDFLFVLTRE